MLVLRLDSSDGCISAITHAENHRTAFGTPRRQQADEVGRATGHPEGRGAGPDVFTVVPADPPEQLTDLQFTEKAWGLSDRT